MQAKKVLITGKTGTVGSNLAFGFGLHSRQYDLRIKEQADALVRETTPDAIVHCAAKVGGLKFHMEQKYKLFYDNVLINTNILDAAKRQNVQRVLSFLSSCVFSDKSPSPYTEAMVHDGEPFAVHLPYGHAKRMLEVQSRICFEEHGLIYNCIIPTNIYGIHDDFNFETGHVVGNLIHRAYLSYLNKTPFTIWGDGNQERDFIYTKDVADLTEWALNNYHEKEPLIFSNNQSVSIRDLAVVVAKKFDILSRLNFDTSKPSGQQVRHLSGTKLINLTNYNFTPLEIGVSETVDWFMNNYPNVRL